MKEGKYTSSPTLSVVTKVFSRWINRLDSRSLGGRRASVVPTLPDDGESHLNDIRAGRHDDEGGDRGGDPSRLGTSLPYFVSVNPTGVLISTLMKASMDIARSLMAVRI